MSGVPPSLLTRPSRAGALLAGAVLAGGRSRRMGRDKALVPLAGRPLALVAAAALRGAGADPVVAVGGDPALEGHGLPVLPDRYPGEGPLGGLVTALGGLGAPVVAVLTCDLPSITPVEARALVAALLGTPGADAAVATVDGRPQFLVGAYRASALGRLADAFDQGERSPRRVAPRLHLVEVSGLHPGHLADADTPEDLAEHLAGRGDGHFEACTPTASAAGGRSGSPPWATPTAGARRVPAVGGAPGSIDGRAERPEVDGGRGAVQPTQPVGEVDVRTAAAASAAGAPLVDVREPDEFAEVRAAGARLVPLGEVPDRLDEFPRDRTVYMICRSGARSLRAAEFLAANGVDAKNVAGGTLAWVDAELPVERGG